MLNTCRASAALVAPQQRLAHVHFGDSSQSSTALISPQRPSTTQHTLIHLNTPQHTSTHLNTPQHTSTHLNTPQHTSTHFNTPQQLDPYASGPAQCSLGHLCDIDARLLRASGRQRRQMSSVPKGHVMCALHPNDHHSSSSLRLGKGAPFETLSNISRTVRGWLKALWVRSTLKGSLISKNGLRWPACKYNAP